MRYESAAVGHEIERSRLVPLRYLARIIQREDRSEATPDGKTILYTRIWSAAWLKLPASAMQTGCMRSLIFAAVIVPIAELSCAFQRLMLRSQHQYLTSAFDTTSKGCPMNILQVNSSARGFANGTGSFSTRLANDVVRGLRAAHPEATLTVRDLILTPHPGLDESALRALFTPAEHRTPEQAARVALDDGLIAELLAADVIVLGVPMYNFGVPSQLKAWFDAIARAGVTFRYTEKGPMGLIEGKTVYAVLTRGGMHRGQPTDNVAPYLRVMLGFLGMTDVHFIYAEGLAMGPDAEARAVADAQAEITRLLEAA